MALGTTYLPIVVTVLGLSSSYCVPKPGYCQLDFQPIESGPRVPILKGLAVIDWEGKYVSIGS